MHDGACMSATHLLDQGLIVSNNTLCAMPNINTAPTTTGPIALGSSTMVQFLASAVCQSEHVQKRCQHVTRGKK